MHSSPVHAAILTVLILCRSGVVRHRCCKFMCVIVLLCPENNVSQQSSQALRIPSLSLEEGVIYTDAPFGAEHSIVNSHFFKKKKSHTNAQQACHIMGNANHHSPVRKLLSKAEGKKMLVRIRRKGRLLQCFRGTDLVKLI